MADMQVAVGLGREARDDRLVPPRLEVGLDDVANEVATWLASCRRVGVCHLLSPAGSPCAAYLPNPPSPAKRRLAPEGRPAGGRPASIPAGAARGSAKLAGSLPTAR